MRDFAELLAGLDLQAIKSGRPCSRWGKGREKRGCPHAPKAGPIRPVTILSGPRYKYTSLHVGDAGAVNRVEVASDRVQAERITPYSLLPPFLGCNLQHRNLYGRARLSRVVVSWAPWPSQGGQRFTTSSLGRVRRRRFRGTWMRPCITYVRLAMDDQADIRLSGSFEYITRSGRAVISQEPPESPIPETRLLSARLRLAKRWAA
jgi:hypothetical protein